MNKGAVGKCGFGKSCSYGVSHTRRADMLRRLTIVPMVAFLAYAIYHYWFWLFNPNTNEYRECVVLLLGDLFQKGINPYTDAAPGNFCFLYGFLGSGIVSAFQGLIGVGSRFLENRLLSIICVIGCAGLIESEVRFWARDRFPRFLAFLVMLNAGWILGEVDSRSDHLALLLFVVALRCLSRKQTLIRVMFSAVLAVLSFYCKQYAILVAVPVFLFLLMRRPALSFAYAAISGVLLLASMLVVDHVFPYYFTMSILSHAILGYDVVHVLIQTVLFGWFYWPFLFALLFAGWLLVQKIRAIGVRNTVDGIGGGPLLHALAAIFGFAFLTFKLAGNVGGVIWYYNLLLLPPLVVVGAYSMKYVPYVWFSRLVLPGLLLFSLWHLGPSRQGFRFGAFAFTPTLSEVEQKAWADVRREIAQCRSDRILLEAPFFADIALDRGIKTYETGVSFPDWVTPSCEAEKFSRLREWFFPDAESALRHSNAYYDAVRKDLANGVFDMLVIEPSESRYIPDCYEKVSDYVLRMGEQKRTVSVYKKRI